MLLLTMPRSYTEHLRIEAELALNLFVLLYCTTNVLVLCRQFSHVINTVGERRPQKFEINTAFSAIVHGSRT